MPAKRLGHRRHQRRRHFRGDLVDQHRRRRQPISSRLKHRPKSVGETGVRASQYSTSSARAAARSASAAVQARTDVPSNANAVPHQRRPPHTAVAKSSIRTGHDTTSHTEMMNRHDHPPDLTTIAIGTVNRNHLRNAPLLGSNRPSASRWACRIASANAGSPSRAPVSTTATAFRASTVPVAVNRTRPSPSAANRAVNIGCTPPPHPPPPPTTPASTPPAPSTPPLAEVGVRIGIEPTPPSTTRSATTPPHHTTACGSANTGNRPPPPPTATAANARTVLCSNTSRGDNTNPPPSPPTPTGSTKSDPHPTQKRLHHRHRSKPTSPQQSAPAPPPPRRTAPHNHHPPKQNPGRQRPTIQLPRRDERKPINHHPPTAP